MGLGSGSTRAAQVQLPMIPQVADWIRAFPGTLSLGQGVAGYPPPAEALAAVERLRGEPLLHRYQSVLGIPELLAALEAKLARVNGIALGADSGRALMVTAGANAGFLQMILAIADPGDEVILTLPYYFNQEMALGLANVRAVLVPGDSRNFPDLDALARAITPRTRAIVTVSPNNPTGAVYPVEILRGIQELCRRHGLYHLSDETYEAFTYDGAAHVSPGSFPDSAGQTISLFSFSKAYGFASWRVGYAVFPASLLESLRKIQDTNLICPPVVSQLGALGCLQAGDAWVAARVAELAEVRRRVLEELRPLEEFVEIAPALGAFYAMLRVRPGVGVPDSLTLTHALIARHRVAVIPGVAFGVGQECRLRVAYGALTADTAAEGVGRLVAGLREILRS